MTDLDPDAFGPDQPRDRIFARRRQRRFRKVPFRFILPNLITLVALCLGLTAIRLASEGRFEHAVYLIILAAIFDGLDGRIARALKGTTRFGAELDSLADFVDFGVAPAMTLYFWSINSVPNLGWFAAMVFAIACALRLARFNVALDDPDKPAWASHFFTGMPAPAGAVVVMLPIYIRYAFLDDMSGRAWALSEIVFVLIVAGLMVSRIPHFSGKQLGRIPREQVIPVLFGIAVIALLLATFTMGMMAVLTVFYLALIPFSLKRQRAHLQAEVAGGAAAVGEPPETADEP